MTLAPATRVGPYEVIAPLGAGGMGEVYRARDNRLGRDVAIKILPAGLSSDPERLRRFEQEAKAAAALNHPGILAVYDVGTHDGWPYIVSELLDGDTLRAHASRPLPPRRAIDYALQIAHGLAAAHDKGIVHRDLKPENIITTSTGRAKILDFGLAKLVQPFASPAADGYQPTIARETQPGVVMGTVGYMSPEQVRGEAADHRSDIFAFGAILYELLSGRRAFSKASVPETLTAILNDEPPDLPAESGIAPGLQRIVDRCLQKNRGARFQSAHDLAFALEQLSATSSSVAVPHTLKALPPSWLPWTLFAAAALACAGLAVFALFDGRQSPSGAQTYRFMVEPPGSFSGTASGSFVAVSPDGRRLAFAANRAGGSVLWVQALDSLTAQPLEETEHAYGPFWSPDSRSVGFFAGGKLKKIPATGGPAQTVADVPRISAGATWNQSGTILFATIPGPIQRVPDTGGTPVAVTSLESSDPEEMHLFPLFLPDGKRFLFLLRHRDPENIGIYVKALDSSEVRLVARVDSKFAYTQPGYLVYARDGLLMAQPFDADRAVTTGDAIPTSERIEQFPATGNIQMSLSVNGVLVYWGTSQTVLSQLAWMDRRGVVIGPVGEPGPYRNPRLSPDGKRVAVESVDSTGNRDIWLVETSRGTRTRFTFDPGRDAGPVWSPDGSAIAWQAARDLRMRPIRGGKEEILYDEPWIPDDWHESGLLCHPPQPRQIGFLVLGDRNRTMKPAVEGQSITTHGRLSPDGRWLAYTSTESGRFEVDLRSFPSGPVRARVSTDGGVQPKWRADGKELFYLGMDSTLMAVSLNLGEGIQPERPRPLFRTGIPTITGTFWHQYDLSPDGQRFLVNVPLSAASSRVTIVTDWPALFRAQ
jgi:serine/threonine protein kinase/Tol biopolymer transport system component